MKFPHAAGGIKKLFTSEILSLIAAILTVVGSVISIIGLAAFTSAGVDTGAAVSLIVLGAVVIAAVVMIIIASVLNIVGIAQSAKDDSSFKTALFFLIITFVLSMTAYIFQSNANMTMYSVFHSISEITELCMTLFIIQGIMNLADKLNNSKVSNKGRSLFKIILCIYLLALIANILTAVFTGSAIASTVAVILVVISGILEIVEYIVFLTYLANAKKMLNN